MKKIIAFQLINTLLFGQLFGQSLFNNNGADIHIKDGAFMIVKTNSLANNAGLINNEGTVVVEGNVFNASNIAASGDTIRLTGNWENNNSYNGVNSWVEMSGGNQLITGSAVTTFNNLSLKGGNSTKRQTLNAITSGTLELNDAELATDVNEMWVSNANTGAITRINGFVSSIIGGKLSRSTNSTATYLYPIGSPSYVNPPSLFRPVEFAPTASAANVYGAMVVKGNATNDGFDVSLVDDELCRVNPIFYHRFYHSTGSDAITSKMFFDPSTDGDWTDQAHWDSPNRWNYINTAIAGNSLGFSTISVSGVNDFSPEHFALARKKFTVNAGPDVEINLGESTTFNPTNTAGTVSSFLWTPPVALSCDNCEKPDAGPTETTTYTLTVTDDAGCSASDALIVSVSAPELLVPTAFSPNGDGVNERFRALNQNIDRYNLQVYNRWGEKVFETSVPGDGWDGVFKGVQQELGVYVWTCQYQLKGQTKLNLVKGNVTLMR
jgi:gliding motility-associated-like protein